MRRRASYLRRPSGTRTRSSGPPGSASRTSAARPSRSGRSCPARSGGCRGPPPPRPPPPSPLTVWDDSFLGRAMLPWVTRRSRKCIKTRSSAADFARGGVVTVLIHTIFRFYLVWPIRRGAGENITECHFLRSSPDPEDRDRDVRWDGPECIILIHTYFLSAFPPCRYLNIIWSDLTFVSFHCLRYDLLSFDPYAPREARVSIGSERRKIHVHTPRPS